MTFAFADFDTRAFLRDTWQKRPLLIRNPWCEWANPLEPDELAGLACEEGVNSRIITRGGDDWQQEEGPVPEDRFAALGKAPWTLLVQAVDHFVPAVAELIEPFRFIPDWRIDDVMVSYATDGGGVGAHFDQYDVFLVQGLGRRRWQLGGLCGEDTALLDHGQLRLLADFQAEEEFVLEPGDMLYVPPRFAHKGEAVGHDCMTYSVGFRAPSRRELIAGWADDVLGRLDDDDRFTDAVLAAQDNPGEITAASLDRVRAIVAETLVGAAEGPEFHQWFGQHTTSPKDLEFDWGPEEEVTSAAVAEALKKGASLIRNPASRFAYCEEGDDRVSLFVSGDNFDCSGASAGFARALCANRGTFGIDGEGAELMELITELVNRGAIAFAED